jgi:hypothetical protein
VVAIGETAAVQDTDDCRSVVVDDVTYATFRVGRRGRIRSIFWPSLSIADQLAKAEWVVQRAQRDVEVAAEAEAIADELAEAAQRPGKLRTDLRALTFLR